LIDDGGAAAQGEQGSGEQTVISQDGLLEPVAAIPKGIATEPGSMYEKKYIL
jgi:hypothetical protein